MAIYNGNSDLEYKSAVICDGMVFNGNIESDCDIVLEGVVNGNIVCHDLIVRESGCITGDVKAINVSLYNTLEGNVTAEQSVYIYGNAKLTGDIVSNSLVCEGNIKGNIDATTLIQVKGNGVVNGDCSAERFFVDDGATLNGLLTTKERVVEKIEVVEEAVESTEE